MTADARCHVERIPYGTGEIEVRIPQKNCSIGSSKAWLHTRCLNRADLIVVSRHLDSRILEEMFTKRVDTVEEATGLALAKHGENAEVLLMMNGSDMIPRLAV